MSRPVQLSRIIRRKSPVHGYGVFADEAISKNKRIVNYDGELVKNGKACDARETRYLKEGCVWVFRINRAWSRDAFVGGNVARFINHACEPNCWVDVVEKTKTIWIRASRTIYPGEELTYDYRIIGEKNTPCQCRPGCRTMI